MTENSSSDTGHIRVGWREWVGLPDLGIDSLKAKIDTGARTSALHTFALETGHEHGQRVVRFGVHPRQHDTDLVKWCQAPITDERDVRDSGGHRERRYVIVTDLVMGSRRWPIEVTLTSRDTMLFRMLIGRTAMSALHVDPGASFLTGRPRPQNR